MVRSGNTYIIPMDEFQDVIRFAVKAALTELKDHPIMLDEDMTAKDVKEALQIGESTFWKTQKGRHPIPFVGSPRKRTIKRSDFEKWKKEHWGKY